MTSPAPDAPRAANRRGVLAMCGAMACLVANDTLVKFASQSLPASELIFVRGVFATALLLVLVRVMGLGGQLPALLDRRVLLRALLDGLGTLAYLISLFHLPLANTNAINMAAPLFITVFAALLFHERVAAARWAAVGVGFTGVLLVVQPVGSAFNAFALLCLLGALLNASRDIVTRTIPRGVHALLITLTTAVGGANGTLSVEATIAEAQAAGEAAAKSVLKKAKAVKAAKPEVKEPKRAALESLDVDGEEINRAEDYYRSRDSERLRAQYEAGEVRAVTDSVITQAPRDSRPGLKETDCG